MHVDPTTSTARRTGAALGWTLTLLLACSTTGCNTFSDVPSFDCEPGDCTAQDTDAADSSQPPDTVDTTDTVDTLDATDTVDMADTVEPPDTADTAQPSDTTSPEDTADAADTSDTSDASDTAMSCVDGDGDGHGEGCAAGDDCDDEDDSVYDGAPELCDARDNDCDEFVDELFPGLNESCPIGDNWGALACTPDFSAAVCCAPREACDGVDNDCDGFIDEDGACSACTEDPYSPNHQQAQHGVLALDVRHDDLVLCPGNDDYFEVAQSPAVVQVTLEHSTADNADGLPYADVDIQVLCGTSCEFHQGTTTSFQFDSATCCAGGQSIMLRVHDAGNISPPSGTPYSLTITQTSP